MSEPKEEGAWEPTKRWLSTLVTVVGLASGFLSWFSSYVLQGAEIANQRAAHAALVVEFQKAREEDKARMAASEAAIIALRVEKATADERIRDIAITLARIDGRLNGSVETVRGRVR